MKVGMLCSRVRQEEKLLFEEFEKRKVEVLAIDDREIFFNLEQMDVFRDCCVIFDRSINFSHSLYILKILNDRNVLTVNTYDVVKNCGDKLLTSLLLERAGVPTPRVCVAFTKEAALDAIETLGYPVVIKPVIGSWGRLIAKAETRTAAEAILEHKTTLGTDHHNVIYLQEYIEKPGRDIRVFVLGNEVISAIYRYSHHWITNTARGGRAEKCVITDDLRSIALATAKAMGGGDFGD